MDAKFKKQLIVIAIILAIFVGVGIYYYKKGKRSTTIAPIIKDNPNSTDADNNPAGASDTEIKRISEALYSDMDGANTFGHDAQPYKDALAASDTDFERIYNQFNTDHQAEGNGTLKTWIISEHPLYDPAFEGLRDSILQRMSKLNLI